MAETKEELIGYLRKMMEIRFFEEKLSELLDKGIVEGASHLYSGEEAVAVGACAAIRHDDCITSTHRGHGHCIAKGGDLKKMMAEVCGKATGYCKGKGGSMHIADIEGGNLGATGIVGGNIPVATGAGLSFKMKNTKQVVLCFFGDGAVNTGGFHESLNMAGTWKLPVIYICENNLYGMSVSVDRAFPIKDITIRAKGYNIKGVSVDGMDVLAVKHTIQDVVQGARAGEGPAMVECKTYRFSGHSKSDARAYRTREEEALWKERCPIKQFSEKLLKEKILNNEELAKLEEDVKRKIEEAEKFAVDSPFPDPEELVEDVYA